MSKFELPVRQVDVDFNLGFQSVALRRLPALPPWRFSAE